MTIMSIVSSRKIYIYLPVTGLMMYDNLGVSICNICLISALYFRFIN